MSPWTPIFNYVLQEAVDVSIYASGIRFYRYTGLGVELIHFLIIA